MPRPDSRSTRPLNMRFIPYCVVRVLRAALVPFVLAPLMAGAQTRAGAKRLPSVRHDFRIADGAFLLDGRPLQIIAGEMHYTRIPRAYWRHRLRMASAMGLNAVSTYVFWNEHEVRPGVFDFRSGNRDLAEFVRIAQEEGLWVILRPGPYVCAEWEFGGLPAYLLKNPATRVRSSDARYLAAVRRYVQALAREVRPLLVTHGGPILLVQVENEYGSFGADSAYTEATRRMFAEAALDVPLFTADGSGLFAEGSIRGVLPTATGETNYDTLVARVNRFHGGAGPYMVSELYPGWLMHWGEPFPATPLDKFLPAYRELLRRGASVNLYMFHGGTNFGFTAGANYSERFPIQPDLTSYDYDAPLSEAGWPTPKFHALRDAIQAVVSRPLPAVPATIPVIAVPPVTLVATGTLDDLLRRATPVRAAQPLAFEELDQARGFVLYRHRFDAAASGTLTVPGLRDYAVVLVNGRRTAVLNRRTRMFSAPISVPAGGRVELLVENMGRINYGAGMASDRKGILEPVRLNGAELTGWEMFRLPLDVTPRAGRRTGDNAMAPAPTVYRGEFSLLRTGDTFLDMRGWEHGVVFVNGVNLGRYWDIGPQRTLYLPGAWLKRGRNEIVIFDLGGRGASASVSGLTAPIFDAASRPAAAPAAANTDEYSDQDLAVAGAAAPVYRIPALAVSAAGTVIAAYDARPSTADLPSNIAIVVRRSTDGGKTWEPQRVVRRDAAHDGFGDPSLVVDRQTRRIFLFHAASRNRGFVDAATGADERDPNVLQADYSYSDDDALTWRHRRITAQIKDPAWGGLFAASGAGIQLVHGRYAGRLIQQYVVRFRGANWGASAYSDDHGETWHMRHLVGPGVDENKSVELSDGTLLLDVRATPYRKVARSADGGVTWTGLHEDPERHDPGNNGSIVRVDADAPAGSARAQWLLSSNDESTSGRRNLVVRLSCDDGRSWPVRRTIEPGSAAYSTLARLPDGTFGLLWERDEYRRISFSAFDLRWLGESCR